MFIAALVTDESSIDTDYDMPLLIEAFNRCNIRAEVVNWDDPSVNWSKYSIVILRSPWSYVDRIEDFIKWCSQVDTLTNLQNPFTVIKWGLNKNYLLDLKAIGVAIVPTEFIGTDVKCIYGQIKEFISLHSVSSALVIKPSVGAYSKGVKTFKLDEIDKATSYIKKIHSSGNDAILQPYLKSIDINGETNLVYFNGEYSHAIRKSALLRQDGTMKEPLQEFRKERDATEVERQIAETALKAVNELFRLKKHLLYARVDLILDDYNQPVVLEMEICEPSLNLSFSAESALSFVKAVHQYLYS